jgi:hypothetical protein
MSPPIAVARTSTASEEGDVSDGREEARRPHAPPFAAVAKLGTATLKPLPTTAPRRVASVSERQAPGAAIWRVRPAQGERPNVTEASGSSAEEPQQGAGRKDGPRSAARASESSVSVSGRS